MPYVMIVDDDEDFAGAVGDELRDAGHEVQIELDPPQALQKMADRTPDLIILDVMFPEDDSAGFSLARQLRQVGGGLQDVPVLMLTAVNARFPFGFSSRDIDDAWLPVSDFLEKPVDFGLLREKVKALLGKAGSCP